MSDVVDLKVLSTKAFYDVCSDLIGEFENLYITDNAFSLKDINENKMLRVLGILSEYINIDYENDVYVNIDNRLFNISDVGMHIFRDLLDDKLYLRSDCGLVVMKICDNSMCVQLLHDYQLKEI